MDGDDQTCQLVQTHNDVYGSGGTDTKHIAQRVHTFVIARLMITALNLNSTNNLYLNGGSTRKKYIAYPIAGIATTSRLYKPTM